MKYFPSASSLRLAADRPVGAAALVRAYLFPNNLRTRFEAVDLDPHRRLKPALWIAAGFTGLIFAVWYLTACVHSERPNVLLITLDATRIDALGCYGGTDAKTPHLDALARESVRFAQAITTTPYTGAAHASLLTGLYPPQHGLRDFLNQTLPESVQSLPEILRDAGYDTAAFLSTYALHARYGLAQGFDTYSCDFWESQPSPSLRLAPRGAQLERRASETVAEALRWLQSRESDRPFFMWVHFYDPHAPYDPPKEFQRPPPADRPLGANELKRRRYYDEVTYMDAQIGQFLDVLRELGLYEHLVVVVVADHGECLGKHGRPVTWHSPFLVDTTVHVPLIVRVPGVLPPGVVNQQVRTIDIFPTILEATHLPNPDGIEGRSVFPLAWARSEEPRSAYSETFYELFPKRAKEGDELLGIRAEGWKLLTRPGREELYDLQADPDELRDVSTDHPDRVAILRSELKRLAARWPADLRPQYIDFSEEEMEEHKARLRSLGYVE